MVDCIECVKCLALIVAVWFALIGWKFFQTAPAERA